MSAAITVVWSVERRAALEMWSDSSGGEIEERGADGFEKVWIFMIIKCVDSLVDTLPHRLPCSCYVAADTWA